MAKAMPNINACDQTDCSYNKHNSCHTMAITVGGPGESCATCDTYLASSSRGGIEDVRGGVGACKMDDCKFNQALECSASSIQVATHQGHPDCKTYSSK